MGPMLRTFSLVAATCLFASTASADSSHETREFLIRADFEEIESRAEEGVDPETLVFQSIEILKRRLDADETDGVEVAYLGEGRVKIEVPRTISRETLEDLLGIPPDIDFRIAHPMAQSCSRELVQARKTPNPDPETTTERDIAETHLSGITEHNIANATAAIDIDTDRPALAILLDEAGTRQLAQLTTENLGKCLKILVDGEVIVASVIVEPILGGGLQVSGISTSEDANLLAIKLRAGALPAQFDIVEERMVD